MKALFLQRCLSGLRSTIGNRVWVEAHRRFKSCSLRQRKRICTRISFFVLYTEYRTGFEDELPVKKSVDNAFKGRDKRMPIGRHERDRAQRTVLREKSRFAGAKRFANGSIYAKGTKQQRTPLIMAERGVPAKGTNPVLCANEKGYAHAYPFFVLCTEYRTGFEGRVARQEKR